MSNGFVAQIGCRFSAKRATNYLPWRRRGHLHNKAMLNYRHWIIMICRSAALKHSGEIQNL